MGAALLVTLLSLNSVVCTTFALQIIRSVRLHTPVISQKKLAFETDMPSVTVCIPARNEEHALAECLQRVINSTYERLEIIVLDDSSSDGTSLLIKSFAHAGVRFVRGSQLPEGWLGKNHALKELAAQANGSYVLFLDVDTRISPTAIENMVRTLLTKGADMVSTIPRRDDGLRASVVWSPLKYYWELTRNRRGAPAVASNAWLIRRSVAETYFKDHANEIKNAVLPEGYVASRLGENYALAISTKEFGVGFEKKWSSQCETSIRLLHPMLGAKVHRSVLASLGLLLLLAPHITALSILWTTPSWVHTFAALCALGFNALYAYYTATFWGRGWVLGFLMWPLIVLQESILIISSALLYTQKRVLWKGRPIRSVRPNAQ